MESTNLNQTTDPAVKPAQDLKKGAKPFWKKFLGTFLTIIGAIISVYYLYVVVVTVIAQQKSDYGLGWLFIAFFAFAMLLGILMLFLGIYLLKSPK